jgi:hypothetical protein
LSRESAKQGPQQHIGGLLHTQPGWRHEGGVADGEQQALDGHHRQYGQRVADEREDQPGHQRSGEPGDHMHAEAGPQANRLVIGGIDGTGHRGRAVFDGRDHAAEHAADDPKAPPLRRDETADQTDGDDHAAQQRQQERIVPPGKA